MEVKNFRGIDYKPIRVEKLFFEGKNQEMPVYEIPLDKIFYNIANGRIGTHINDYNINNPDRKLDQLMKEDIVEFNNEMEKLILSSDKSNRFNDTKANIKERSQQVPGVILSDGTILDGNRRYTSLRQLYNETRDAKFHKFETMIIDTDDNDLVKKKSIKMLEIQLQHGKDEKVDYSPIQKLVDIYNNVSPKSGEDSLLNDYEYYKSANIKKNEYFKLKNRMEIMVDFCEYISMPEKFSVVEKLKLDGPINEISNFSLKIKRSGDEEKYENYYKPLIYSILISNKEGDITRNLRGLFKTYESRSLDKLVEQQLENIEKIYERLRTIPAGNELSEIGKLQLTNNAEELIKSFEDTIYFEKRKERQGSSLTNVNSAIKNIENIDHEEFKHMPEEQVKKIRTELIKLRELILNLFEKMNDD